MLQERETQQHVKNSLMKRRSTSTGTFYALVIDFLLLAAGSNRGNEIGEGCGSLGDAVSSALSLKHLVINEIEMTFLRRLLYP